MERLFPRVSERRVTQVMGKGDAFGEVFIQHQRPRHIPADLRRFHGMGKPCAVVVALVCDEDLRFSLEPPECGAVDHAVAVSLEGEPSRIGSLFIGSSQRSLVRYGIGCQELICLLNAQL